MTHPRKHRHADMIRRWLDDDSLEVEMEVGENAWQKDKNPTWDEDYEFRFKPKMIRCGDLEFPEPMRVPPEDGTKYWVVDLLSLSAKSDLCWETSWTGNLVDKCYLERGIGHTTQAAAEAHARALIALTESKS